MPINLFRSCQPMASSGADCVSLCLTPIGRLMTSWCSYGSVTTKSPGPAYIIRKEMPSVRNQEGATIVPMCRKNCWYEPCPSYSRLQTASKFGFRSRIDHSPYPIAAHGEIHPSEIEVSNIIGDHGLQLSGVKLGTDDKGQVRLRLQGRSGIYEAVEFVWKFAAVVGNGCNSRHTNRVTSLLRQFRSASRSCEEVILRGRFSVQAEAKSSTLLL